LQIRVRKSQNWHPLWNLEKPGRRVALQNGEAKGSTTEETQRFKAGKDCHQLEKEQNITRGREATSKHPIPKKMGEGYFRKAIKKKTGARYDKKRTIL